MSLDTLANVKTRLGISGSSDDSLVSLLMDSADDWIKSYTGRDFAGGTFTEYFDGNQTSLPLANYPITSVSSVKVDPAGTFGSETVIDSNRYALHAERGVIQSKAGPFVPRVRRAGLVNADVADWTRNPRAVQVVYTTATSAVPHDVKQAYALLIGHWYRQVKTRVAAGHQHLYRQRYGEVTLTFQPDAVAGLTVPAEVHRLLAPYRTPPG